MPDSSNPLLSRDFAAGGQAVLPILLSVLPFALITGVAAVRLGFSTVEAGGFSLLMFAGASQLAAMQLIHGGAPLAVILITVLFINLRFTMYSASLAAYFRGAHPGVRALAAYLLTDQTYMISLYGFTNREHRARQIAFYLGVGLPLWFGWQVATLVGALLGARLPDAWGLDFAVPLTFIAMIMPAIRGRPTIAAAVVGGGVALAGHALPWNLGLIAGSIAGIMAGTLAAALLEPRAES